MRRILANSIRVLRRPPADGASTRSRPSSGTLRLDDLQLHDAVIGERTVLQELPNREFALYTVEAGDVAEVGCFRGAAEAWRAIDALDDVRGASHPRGPDHRLERPAAALPR